MKHEHEVKVPEELKERVVRVEQYLRENKKLYLFGLGGIVVGAAGARIFSRSPITVVVHTTAAATVD